MDSSDRQLRALVIDDNAVNRRLAVALLDAHGIPTDEAHDGGAGIAMMRLNAYDFVLLDISMPGVNGDEVCKMIRADEALRDIYVVAYTAHAFPSEKASMLQAGFDSLLIKPVTFQSLTQAIEPVLVGA